MRAEGGKREREKEEKEKEKGGKNGDQNRFFVCFFFFKSTRRFYHMRSGRFSNILGKLYLDLVDHIRYCDKIFNCESIWRLVRAKMHPHPYFGNFFKYLWPS